MAIVYSLFNYGKYYQMDNRLEIAKEGLRHTERRLEGYLQTVASYETRAMQFAAFNATIGSVLIVNFEKLPTQWSGIFIGLVFLCVAYRAVSILLTKNFHTIGHFWREWEPHIDDEDDLLDVIKSQGRENDLRLDYNEEKISRMSKIFNQCYFADGLAVCFLCGAQLPHFF